MKILVIAAGPFPAARGTPARTLRVAEALQARGHAVCVAAFPLLDPDIPTGLRIERSRGVPGYTKTSPGPSVAKLLRMNPRLRQKVGELLRAEPFDVIYAHHYEGLLVAHAARRRHGQSLPIVFDSHTLLHEELPSYVPRWLAGPVGWLGGVLDKRLSQRADAVICVTDTITNYYATFSAPDRPVVTATNGVEVDKFVRIAATGAESDTIRLVFAGNLSGYQGIDLLIAAFRRVRRRVPGIELVLAAAGAAELLSKMGIENPGAQGIVTRSGAFSELPLILASADIAANPRTVCPGIPQKLLNYMASALPTVSFEGSAAILTHERTGLIVPDGDVVAFAEAIERLAVSRELRSRLGAAARDLVEKSFTWDQVAATFERVYHRLQLPGEQNNAK